MPRISTTLLQISVVNYAPLLMTSASAGTLVDESWHLYFTSQRGKNLLSMKVTQLIFLPIWNLKTELDIWNLGLSCHTCPSPRGAVVRPRARGGVANNGKTFTLGNGAPRCVVDPTRPQEHLHIILHCRLKPLLSWYFTLSASASCLISV